jgi:hypothetical protein
MQNIKKGNYYLQIYWFPSAGPIDQGYSSWHINFNETQIKRLIPRVYNVQLV